MLECIGNTLPTAAYVMSARSILPEVATIQAVRIEPQAIDANLQVNYCIGGVWAATYKAERRLSAPASPVAGFEEHDERRR